MTSRRLSAETLSSPCRPSSTMRIFSSAEKRRRVFLWMSRTVFSADFPLALSILLHGLGVSLI